MDKDTQKQITTWLLSACLLIFLMLIIGGITRLTRSGLSIVEWHPISGIIPPLSDTVWQVEFEKYQKFPEYQKLNQTMTLDQFKFIFFLSTIETILKDSELLIFLASFFPQYPYPIIEIFNIFYLFLNLLLKDSIK